MQSHLHDILTQHYANQVARTSFIDKLASRVTPGSALHLIRQNIQTLNFPLNYESGVIADFLSYLVISLHYALTEKELEFRGHVYARQKAVITDHVYQLDDGVKILWENKSPKVFDAFIRKLMEEMRSSQSSLNLCASMKRAKYQGYEAILSKVCFACISQLHG